MMSKFKEQLKNTKLLILNIFSFQHPYYPAIKSLNKKSTSFFVLHIYINQGNCSIFFMIYQQKSYNNDVWVNKNKKRLYKIKKACYFFFHGKRSTT